MRIPRPFPSTICFSYSGPKYYFLRAAPSFQQVTQNQRARSVTYVKDVTDGSFHCTFFLLLILCVPAIAQEKPEAPKPKVSHRIFIAGVSLLAASQTADAITTRMVLDRGGWENNPVFGRHPSPAQQAGINLGIFAAQSGLFYLAERNHHKWIRWTGRILLANEIVEHARLAACNTGIDLRSPVIQNCGPLTPF